MKRLIVTADDFGASESVNEAVEQAHRRGILTAASLMVGAPAADDAIARARRLPGLRVGLHVVVVCGRPVLSPADIPALVEPDGRLSDDLLRTSLRVFFQIAARRQLEAEVRAQFEAFRASGLPLDHVNAHNHLQLHPTILGTILRIGGEFGLRAARLPYQPPHRGADGWGTGLGQALLTPWIALVRRRLRAAGVHSNDYMFGLRETGHMDEAAVVDCIRALPEGVSEIYFHPSTDRRTQPFPADYDSEAELAALLSPAVAAAVRDAGVERIAFADLH